LYGVKGIEKKKLWKRMVERVEETYLDLLPR
jgi:hypothetical protein